MPKATRIKTLTSSSSSSSLLPPRANFLSLPLEIRLQIYAYLLLLPEYSSHTAPPYPVVHLSILATNRQIHQEATALLYTKNTFLAHSSLLTSFPRLRTWYPPVREPKAAARIRRFHLVVRLDCDLPYTRDAAAKAFSGMDELTVDVKQAMFLGVGYENLRVLEGVRAVKDVVIRGSTTGFEDYVDWLRAVMESDGRDEVGEFAHGLLCAKEMSMTPWPFGIANVGWATAAAGW